ncbi:unnamed protein product [Sphagnum jensenii]|uniref:Uncharacterized protein n=1 Tax=Sphagnum jensenii TaxID=128206 RepID=A0ABP0WC38_9BRYO
MMAAASLRSGYGSSCVLCVCFVMLMLLVSTALAVPGSEGSRNKYRLRGDHMKPAYDVEMVGITLDQAMITSVEPARRLTEEETMQPLKEGREALGMNNDYASGCVASANSKDDPIPSPCP